MIRTIFFSTQKINKKSLKKLKLNFERLIFFEQFYNIKYKIKNKITWCTEIVIGVILEQINQAQCQCMFL